MEIQVERGKIQTAILKVMGDDGGKDQSENPTTTSGR